jgi:DNA-binding transcriptional MocR family regulator
MDAERMAQVYAVARKWSLVIIEDDAYYWLQYPNGPDNVPGLDLRRESGVLLAAAAGFVVAAGWEGTAM